MPDTNPDAVKVDCPKCGRKVRLRKGGTLPVHRIDIKRAFRNREIKNIDRCPASGTLPTDWSTHD